MEENIIMILIGGFVLFMIFGIILRTGKANWLVSGYSILPEDEKAKLDILKLYKRTGNLLIFIGIAFLADYLCSKYINFPYEHLILVAVILIAVFGNLIYINTGNRFTKK
ncbi:membrane protein [Clostridium acetobutylicum]|nr:membrane protein [Clostridium acetobutylicum]